MKQLIALFVMLFIFLYLTTGCTKPLDVNTTYVNYYNGPFAFDNTLRQFYVSSDMPIYVLSNDSKSYQFSLLKNTELYSNWYFNDKLVMQLKDDNTIESKSSLGVLSGNFQFLAHSLLVIKYNQVDGKDVEQFFQYMNFEKMDDCNYTVNILTFGIQEKYAINKCKVMKGYNL